MTKVICWSTRLPGATDRAAAQTPMFAFHSRISVNTDQNSSTSPLVFAGLRFSISRPQDISRCRATMGNSG